MELSTVYEIQEELGRGSYGVVRKCIEKKTKKIVAIKEISMELGKDEGDKIANEIRICQKLQYHERIVLLEDVIYCEHHVYIVFEYLSGGDLFDSILTRDSYSEKKACELSRQILEAIQYCHQMRIVHRDLKPENIFVCRRNSGEAPQLKLIDFGIACEMPEKKDFITCDMTGSPLYMAPERILERPCGYSVDVWSCGVIIFVLMVGYPPFWSDDIETLFLLIVQGNYTFHLPYWSNASNDVKDLIKQMLEMDPLSRISATDALNHSWFQSETKLPSENQEKTLRTLEAFNTRRKLKSVALVLIARKRFSSQVSRKLEKARKKRPSTSYIPDEGLESYTTTFCQKIDQQKILKDVSADGKAPKVLKVTIRAFDQ